MPKTVLLARFTWRPEAAPKRRRIACTCSISACTGFRKTAASSAYREQHVMDKQLLHPLHNSPRQGLQNGGSTTHDF
jgi:hypothetical protein